MSGTPTAAPRPRVGEDGWWLDQGLARLAFGTRQGTGGTSTEHLAYLPNEALELDLADPAQREFGDYELLEQIGQGGMGVVYRARQRRLERDVALKLLSAGPWASEDFVAAFRREARNAAGLQHPNIVAVYEMGEHDGLIFYAMELVRGQSLAQALDARGRFAPRAAAALVRTVAEAVDYAHRLGVLHLDLKPGNILLAEDGLAKVTDFGLARRLGQAPSVENEQVSGTPSYMAPEQAQVRSTRLSAATDIWGLGAILHELLTGRPPFVGDDPRAILKALIESPVADPRQYAAMPEDLRAICLKCLHKQPSERYPSARELADDLGRYLEGRAVQARPLSALQRVVRWARREPKLALASAAAVAALLAGLVATTQQWQRAEAHARTASERLWAGRREAALRLEEQGEGWLALPQLLDNVREQATSGGDGAGRMDRMRIDMLLARGATPIDAIAVADANPLALALSEDGSRMALALSDQSVRWFDTATLTERGRIDLHGRIGSGGQTRSIVLLRFIGNDRLRATHEWYRNQVGPSDSDTWLLDLSAAAVIEPPTAFGDLSDASYGADGRRVLLRNRRGEVQLWGGDAVPESPQPLSPRRATTAAVQGPWLFAGDGHAMVLDVANATVHVHALPSLDVVHRLPMSRDAGLSAWAASRDGRQVAFGDAEGRVSLLDLAAGGLRMLPTSRGREVTWLSFSDDGEWLVAGASDGRVHAFDVASGDTLASGSMAHDFPVRRVGIDRHQGLMVVAGEGQVALWRLPGESGPRALPPIRIGTPPSGHRQAGPYAIDWSLRSGLLASAGIDGQVRLWRLPLAPTLAVLAPRQFAEDFRVGGRVVDVAWDRWRTVDLAGRAATPWRSLPQPPGYAELVAADARLLVTVGTRLLVLDAASGSPRGAPIELGATPQRLLVSADGLRALVDVGVAHPSGYGDRLRLYDVGAGRQSSGEVVLPGPLLSLAFSPDGQRVVTVGPADAGTTVLAVDPLRVLREFPHDPYQPVVAADFDRGSDDLLLVTRAEDPRLGTDALLVWDPASDEVSLRLPTGQARPYGVIVHDGGAFLPGEADHLVFDGRHLRHVPRTASATDTTMGAFAGSADGRLVAVAGRHTVHLYDRAGVPVGPPVRIDTPATEGIVALGFAADGRHLLARTTSRVATLPLAARNHADLAELDDLMARLGEDGRYPQLLRVPAPAQRGAWRARDPGAWRAPEARPTFAVAGHAAFDGLPIPARPPDTPADLLDLSVRFTLGPDSVRNSYTSIKPFLRPFPAGVQRLRGVDFDLRGMVEIGPAGLACVPVPPGAPVAAVHALLMATVPTRLSRPRRLAELRWRYADGGEARVPIRATREVPGYGGNDRRVPHAFSPKLPRAAMGLRSGTVAAPRLPNPQPHRPLRCLDLQPLGASVLLFALTLEREATAMPAATAGPVARVIAAPGSVN